MTISSILVTSDNYWMGGRETFLIANISLLKQHKNIRACLLADDIAAVIPQHIFERERSLSKLQNPTIKAWMNEGAGLIKQNRPDLIWAQHYRTLPAWLLSMTHGIPLHVTFHGPLLSAGAVGTREEALGVTLAIHRGGVLSAVSKEIIDELLILGAAKEKIRLMPNKVFVHLPGQERLQKPIHEAPIKLVMLTRQEKLGHIRAAVQFLHAIRKLGYRAKLTIYSGLQFNSEDDLGVAPIKSLDAAKRLGRKWLFRNPKLISNLPHISFRSPTSDPEKAIIDADLVLGMGRVVLEGLAANKPTVLVGYEQVIGLITKETFSEYQYSNFSGRGLKAHAINAVAELSIKKISASNPIDWEIVKMVDINERREEALAIHEMATNMHNWDAQLNKAISCQMDALLNGDIDEPKFLNGIYKALSMDEMKTYKALLQAR